MAVRGNPDLTDCVLGGSVEYIGRDAFQGSPGLFNGTLVLPASLLMVGHWAFRYCNLITDVHFSGPTIVEDYAFDSTDVSRVTFSSSITAIPASMLHAAVAPPPAG